MFSGVQCLGHATKSLIAVRNPGSAQEFTNALSCVTDVSISFPFNASVSITIRSLSFRGTKFKRHSTVIS